MKILYTVSSAGTALSFLRGQLSAVRVAGHSVTLVCPETAGGEVEKMCRNEGAEFRALNIRRTVDIRQDLWTLKEALKVIRQLGPDLLIAGTPKASLLFLLVGLMAGVKHRVYLCHGLRFEGFTGVARFALVVLERLFCLLATDVVAVSPSVKSGLESLGAPSHKIVVLGKGSPNGIDTERFSPLDREARSVLQRRLSFSPDTWNILFVGRLAGDKGLRHLAFLASELPEVTLWLAGDPELSDSSDELYLDKLRGLPNVRELGARGDIHDLMRAADLLVLPSVREGMPTVLLEAAAVGLPAVAMTATGVTDAVSVCESGVLTPQGDSRLFASACAEVLKSSSKRTEISAVAPANARRNFSQEIVWSNWVKYISSLEGGSSSS